MPSSEELQGNNLVLVFPSTIGWSNLTDGIRAKIAIIPKIDDQALFRVVKLIG